MRSAQRGTRSAESTTPATCSSAAISSQGIDARATGPVHAVFNAASPGRSYPGAQYSAIPLGFQVPGSIDAITLFPRWSTFGELALNLDVRRHPSATIPAITFPEVPAERRRRLYVIAGDIR